MFHFSLYNQIYPIIIQHEQAHAFALSLRTNQFQYFPQQQSQPRRTRKKKTSKPANKPISNGKQSEAQRTALKAGLQKSLDSTNKGFEILKKMGYEEGKPLGKAGSGITEPLSITIKNNPRNRAGLGQEPNKSVAIKKESIESEVKTAKAAETKVKVPPITIKQETIIKSEPICATTKREKRLVQLRTEYREDIELLRLRLQAELSVKSKERDLMIVAKITITNEAICDEIYEIIHQYLVNSLHVYKETPYPMFHDIAHVDDEIKVICEDKPTFDYLSKCILALSLNLDMGMSTTRVSPVGENIYWFAVQMEGLVSGAQSFVMQIKKHRFELHPDRWIIVSQTPIPKANKTNLQIITDEQSAMLLIFRHSLKLFVCMEQMDFVLRGKIPF